MNRPAKVCPGVNPPGRGGGSSLCQGIIMSVRAASLLLMTSLLLLAGCAEQRTSIHNFTSGELITGDADSDAIRRPLSSAQVAALSDWIKASSNWSGYSIDIPDRPSLEVDMQEDGGQSDQLMIYQHDNGSAKAYLYHAERLVPLRRDLSSADLAALKAILNQQ
jgi:hypothetical protein